MEDFKRMIEDGEFAEWAEVHGNLYGTAIKTLEEYCRNGIDVILDIDCQGARQLKERYQGGVYILSSPRFRSCRRLTAGTRFRRGD
jgi:guanylate kinase